MAKAKMGEADKKVADGDKKVADGEKTMSRMEMVRAALQALGSDAKPLQLQEHIKTAFGEEIPTNIISNYKFQINNKAGGGATTRRSRQKATEGALRIEDFEAVRGLVNRLGADQVKRLVDVVA